MIVGAFVWQGKGFGFLLTYLLTKVCTGIRAGARPGRFARLVPPNGCRPEEIAKGLPGSRKA